MAVAGTVGKDVFSREQPFKFARAPGKRKAAGVDRRAVTGALGPQRADFDAGPAAEKYLADYRNSGLLEHVRHGEYRKTNIGVRIAA